MRGNCVCTKSSPGKANVCERCGGHCPRPELAAPSQTPPTLPTTKDALQELTFEHVALLMNEAHKAIDPRRKQLLHDIAEAISHTPASVPVVPSSGEPICKQCSKPIGHEVCQFTATGGDGEYTHVRCLRASVGDAAPVSGTVPPQDEKCSDPNCATCREDRRQQSEDKDADRIARGMEAQ